MKFVTLCGVSGATLGEEAKYFTLRISVITSPAFWHILVPLQLRSLNKSIAFRTNSYSARCGRRTAFNGSTTRPNDQVAKEYSVANNKNPNQKRPGEKEPENSITIQVTCPGSASTTTKRMMKSKLTRITIKLNQAREHWVRCGVCPGRSRRRGGCLKKHKPARAARTLKAYSCERTALKVITRKPSEPAQPCIVVFIGRPT